jgi:hypothetical protein
MYLNSDYDGMEVEQVEELLEALNPRLPSPEHRIIHQVLPQLDRFDNPKGRVFHFKATNTFYDFCKARGFKLSFGGGDVTCITQADKTRLNMVRNSRRPDDYEERPPGTRGRGYGGYGGYGYAGGRGRGSDRGDAGPSGGYGWGAEKRPRT